MARALHEVAGTSHFDFLYGSYVISNWRVPYLSTTMTFQEASEALHLASELPGSEEIPWKVDELYQRDIDWSRVSQQIVPYLRNPDQPQFFNSLTIALMPYDSGTRSTIERFDSAVDWNAPNLTKPERFGKSLEIGPIHLGFWDDWNAFSDPSARSGQVRWNPDEVFAVAIDGQHRLAAIKELASGGMAQAQYAETRVPVILLIFDDRLGYRTATPRPSVQMLRDLFIDLNKHALTVSRARQILLDDRDPLSVAVRRLIGESLSEDISTLSDTEPRLPLSLVDWYSEDAKFDEGPSLTTVLGMDWIVGSILGIKPIKDFTDYQAVRKQLQALQSSLWISLSGAYTKVNDLEQGQQTPFAFSSEDLARIASATGRVWSQVLKELLTSFDPYAALISRRISDQSFALDFQNWHRLYKRQKADQFSGRATDEYRQFLGVMANHTTNPRGETSYLDRLASIDALKHDNLAFKVAFQRAYILAFLEFVKITDSAIWELDDNDVEPGPYFEPEDDDGFESNEVESDSLGLQSDDELDQLAVDQREGAARYLERASQFVAILNRILASFPDFLSTDGLSGSIEDRPNYFWQGTLRKPEGGIDFTQGASTRAKDLIFMCAAMVLFDEISDADELSDFDEFWNECVNGSGLQLCKRVGRAISRYSNGASTSAGRILKGRDQEFDEDAALDEVRSRLEFLWEAVGL